MKRVILVAVLAMTACGGTERDDWRGNEVTYSVALCGQPSCRGESNWGGSLAPTSTFYDCEWFCGYHDGNSRTWVHVTFQRNVDDTPGCGWHVLSVETDSARAACPPG